MEASGMAPAEAEAQPDGVINIEQFTRIDLRVGTIVTAERIPNADKLLRLEVDLAEGEPRQLLAGIAEWYAPETLIGQKVIVVANLQPRRMRGLESNGMLLAACDGVGKPLFATVPADAPNGERLR
jgi:methionyl-tRNA synthetase